MPRLCRALGLALIAVAAPRPVLAHEIHTTLTVFTPSSDGVTFTVRSFADDFSASVARHAGHAMPRDSSVRADEVARYVQARFAIADREGHPLSLQSCGLRRQGELYFACFRVAVTGGIERLRVRNAMLTELHADQVNIVQVEHRGARRTLLFTRTSGPAMLGA